MDVQKAISRKSCISTMGPLKRSAFSFSQEPNITPKTDLQHTGIYQPSTKRYPHNNNQIYALNPDVVEEITGFCWAAWEYTEDKSKKEIPKLSKATISTLYPLHKTVTSYLGDIQLSINKDPKPKPTTSLSTASHSQDYPTNLN